MAIDVKYGLVSIIMHIQNMVNMGMERERLTLILAKYRRIQLVLEWLLRELAVIDVTFFFFYLNVDRVINNNSSLGFWDDAKLLGIPGIIMLKYCTK